MTPRLQGLALFLMLSLAPQVRLAAQADSPPTGFVTAYLAEARGKLAEGDAAAARAACARALERDWNSLEALQLLAEIATRQADLDTAVHSWHRWLDVHDTRNRKSTPERKLVHLQLEPIDSEAKTWEKLQSQYVRGLLDLGKQYRSKRDLLGAIDIYLHVLSIAPGNPDAGAAIQQIRTTGGKEVAVEDVYGGTDPTGGMAEDELAAMDREHVAWDKAYTDESDNYRYRTNAGYLVLKTSRIAMEQMNMFYRRFFRFMEDGGNTPKIEIRIFKNRDEYLKFGAGPPAEWSAGHFIGSAVETYAGGVTGKESVRSMYGTLFHEAAHQFVSLTGPMVPGWLNEAYASFFEGCVILSNGQVKWNRVPPGRLFPLAKRMEGGWMRDIGEAGPDESGQYGSPTGAPPFRMIVESQYRWGPPWYAPTWGVVYFLYNYRADDGRTVYRDALHAYYTSYKRGRPKDAVAHFEEIVLAGAPLSPVQKIDALDPIWKAWILRLRDIETGKIAVGDELMRWARAALERDDNALALEFLEEARERTPADAEVLWQLASVLASEKKRRGEAAARLREFRRALEARGETDDPRHAEAHALITRLDPLVKRYRAMKQKLATEGLALAKSYEARELPTMALEIARRMTARYSVPAAMAYYAELAARTGVSLARWRVAYDERSLNGWSGADRAFQAYGKNIRAEVAREGDRMVTRELTADVTFDADFSLSAEMQVPVDNAGLPEGDLVGLCFGRKGDQRYHAVLLHPKGYLDISTNQGGVWTVHDHRSIPVGTSWHELRIDVTGSELDVYFDGLYVRSLQFADAAVVRGAFGLLCGPGKGTFRNVRILGRDAFDPAARIEREIAMQQVMADPQKRTPGTFSGFVPPEFGALQFVQGEAVTLGALRDRPVMLVFWSPRVDKIIPCLSWLRHAIARSREQGLAVVVLCDAATGAGELQSYLATAPLDDATIAIDGSGRTYDAFFLKPGFFGMPRVLLIDEQGLVVFEGDPGLRKGEAWQPKDGPTYVDAALDKLLGK